jgi:hypothetical protein
MNKKDKEQTMFVLYLFCTLYDLCFSFVIFVYCMACVCPFSLLYIVLRVLVLCLSCPFCCLCLGHTMCKKGKGQT